MSKKHPTPLSELQRADSIIRRLIKVIKYYADDEAKLPRLREDDRRKMIAQLNKTATTDRTIRLAVLVQKGTDMAVLEHSEAAPENIGGALALNENEMLYVLHGDVIRKLLDIAEFGDQRIDDIIKRLVL